MEEIVGYDDSKFYDADTAASLLQSDLRVLQGGEPLRSEESNLNPLTGETSVVVAHDLFHGGVKQFAQQSVGEQVTPLHVFQVNVTADILQNI